MYLVDYRLTVGVNRHYAPSARAAVQLIQHIEASGGAVNGITRTRDGRPLTVEDLQVLAGEETGPVDSRESTFGRAFRRFLKLGRRSI